MALAAIVKRAGTLAACAFIWVCAGGEKASAQPTFNLSILPEVVTEGTRCQAIVSRVRPGAHLRLFASVNLGSSRVGPWSTPCGDVFFDLLLAPDVRYLRAADGTSDANGSAVLRFKIPATLPSRYNGVKVNFQCAAVKAVTDGSGGCTAAMGTSNLDCATIQLEVR